MRKLFYLVDNKKSHCKSLIGINEGYSIIRYDKLDHINTVVVDYADAYNKNHAKYLFKLSDSNINII